MDKKENCRKTRNLGQVFGTGCVFYRLGDWDDLQIGLNVSLHDDFEIQFTGLVPVFSEFSGLYREVLVRSVLTSIEERCLGRRMSNRKILRNISKLTFTLG